MPASRRAPHLALPHEDLYCPDGHKLEHNVWAAGDSPMLTQRCVHREPPGKTVCNLCVYWLMLPGGFRILLELTSAEAHDLEKRRLNLVQLLEFLGLRWKKAA